MKRHPEETQRLKANLNPKPKRHPENPPPSKPPLKVTPIEYPNKKFIILTQEEFKVLSQIQNPRSDLCCYTDFLFGQQLLDPQSISIEYKMFKYPFGAMNQETLKRTICSFVNTSGGHIYIGISETPEKRRVVQGLFLSEAEKESIQREVRNLVKCIHPELVVEQKVITSFVPVKKRVSDKDYMRGQYIIKIKVVQGNPRKLYKFKSDTGFKGYIRVCSECVAISKFIVKAEELRRINLPHEEPSPKHTCPPPFVGNPSYHTTCPMYESVDSKKIEKRVDELKLVVSKTVSLPNNNAFQILVKFIENKSVQNAIHVLVQSGVTGKVVKIMLEKDILGLNKKIQELNGEILIEAMNLEVDDEDIISDHSLPSSDVVIEGWTQGSKRDKRRANRAQKTTTQTPGSSIPEFRLELLNENRKEMSPQPATFSKSRKPSSDREEGNCLRSTGLLFQLLPQRKIRDEEY